MTSTTLTIDILDSEGNPTGRSVPVEVKYWTEGEMDGMDADGRRGMWREWIEMECHLAPGDAATMDSAQVEQVCEEAKRRRGM